MSATKIWRLSSKRFGPAKPGILKCAPFSYAAKPAHGPMPSSSCSPIRSSNIWRRVGAPWISPWKKASTPSRRSVSWKCRPRMPPAITASPHLVTPSRNYCTVPTSSSQRPSPSLVPACPRRKNSSQNGLCSKFSPLTGFWRFVLGGEDGLEERARCGRVAGESTQPPGGGVAPWEIALCLDAGAAYAASAGRPLGAAGPRACGHVVARLGHAQRRDSPEDYRGLVLEGGCLGGLLEGVNGTAAPEDLTTAASRSARRTLSLQCKPTRG